MLLFIFDQILKVDLCKYFGNLIIVMGMGGGRVYLSTKLSYARRL